MARKYWRSCIYSCICIRIFPFQHFSLKLGPDAFPWFERAMSFVERFCPHVIVVEMGASRVRSPIYDSLVFGRWNCVLEFFPRCMRPETETAGPFRAPSSETFRAPPHAEWLFSLRFILRGAHDPVLVLFLLLGQDLCVPLRQAFSFARGTKLTQSLVSERKWLLSI